jgi:hypothetical protein
MPLRINRGGGGALLQPNPDFSKGRVSSSAGPVVPGGPRKKAIKERTPTPVVAFVRPLREQGVEFKQQEGRRRQVDVRKNLGRGKKIQEALTILVTATCGPPISEKATQMEPAFILFGLPLYLQESAAADAILQVQIIMRALLSEQEYEPSQIQEIIGKCYFHQEEYRQKHMVKGKASGSGKYQSHRVMYVEVATDEGVLSGAVAAIRQAFFGFEINPRTFLPVFSGGFRFYVVARMANLLNPILYANQGHKGDYLHPEQCFTLLSTTIPLRGVKAVRSCQTLGLLLARCGVMRR